MLARGQQGSQRAWGREREDMRSDEGVPGHSEQRGDGTVVASDCLVFVWQDQCRRQCRGEAVELHWVVPGGGGGGSVDCWNSA